MDYIRIHQDLPLVSLSELNTVLHPQGYHIDSFSELYEMQKKIIEIKEISERNKKLEQLYRAYRRVIQLHRSYKNYLEDINVKSFNILGALEYYQKWEHLLEEKLSQAHNELNASFNALEDMERE